MFMQTIRVQVRDGYRSPSCSLEENVMSLDAFVHYENLILFKKQLADPRVDDAQRQQLLRLLAEEEAKDSNGSPIASLFG